MRRKPFTPKEDIAVGFIGTAGSIYVFVRAFTQMKDHWQQPMVLSILFGLFSISMIYSGFNQLKREKAKKAAEEEIKEAKAQSLKDIHDEMVDVALCASEEILGREVDKSDNEKLARNFINSLDK